MKKNPGRKERRRMHRNFVKDYAKYKVYMNERGNRRIPKNA